jgi:peptidoglycan hydrolase-like protein with peptidoglycan-binding domain
MKLNTKGIAHVALLAVIIVGVAAFGTYRLVASNAATCKTYNWYSGKSSTCVKNIQRITNAAGPRHWHYSGNAVLAVDGIFGPKTKAQVKAFQRFGKLSQDGIVGPKTWTVLCADARLLGSANDGYKAAVASGCVYTVANKPKPPVPAPKPTPAPAPKPSPAPAPAPTPGKGSKSPSQILNLSNWYLTLPIGSPTATMVNQPALSSYSSQYFFANSTNNGIVFHAPVSGTTTVSSAHTRSELRETAPNGTLPWGWSAGSGTHVMTASEAITHLPGGNGTLSFAQIHGPSSTWYLILDAVGTGNGTAQLVVKDNTGKATGVVIDPSYKIGARFNLTVAAINGVVVVDYNGVRKVTTSSTQAGSYFKIGAYNQSAGDFGEAVVYSLSATHR